MPSLLATAVDKLFDDAGLFPPASRPMAEALRAHHAAVTGPWAGLVGPFLCPVSRLDELDACVASGLPRPQRIGLIAYDVGRLGRRPNSVEGLAQFEAPLGTKLPDLGTWVLRYLEVPAMAKVHEALDRIAELGARAKLRCGGMSRDDVPAPDRVADVLVGCVERGLVLKATAGLHEPFTTTGPSGRRYGFVNLLAAAASARTGSYRAQVAEVLATEEPQALDLVHRLTRARELLKSVGTCSIDEPVDALVSRGLL
ncbi:MAG TPA: hypothetical protein VKA65_13925 [Acidimicrobiales bacterium]|nr:hypothetical protein [Acidimicrobiales bacterium]